MIAAIFYDFSRNVPGGSESNSCGSESWAQDFLYPVKDSAANIQDITALKQAEDTAQRQTEALKCTLNLLAREPDLDKVLAHVLTAIAQQLNAPSSNLWFYNATTQIISLHMSYYDGRIFMAFQPGGDAGVASYNVSRHELWRELQHTRRPVAIALDEIARDPHVKEYHQWMAAQGAKTMLSIPLLLEQQLIGTFVIYNKERSYWRPEEIQLAQALSGQASLALQLTRSAQQGRQSAVFEERNRMACEIHDTLAQAFAGILLQLGAAKCIARQQPEEVWSRIERVCELAQEGLAESRRLLWALCPEALEYSDLANALARSVEQMTCGTPIRAQVCIQGTPRPLRTEVSMNLLRIGQEALTNALKHAQAQDIRIELTFEVQQVRLSVRDNGQGFDPKSSYQSGGFGLIGMRQRVERIGGQLTIATQPGRGTEIVVQIPIAEI